MFFRFPVSKTRRIASSLSWLLLLALGCSGSCGDGCMAPIPGGFPPEERGRNAITAKLSKEGLGLIENELGGIIEGQVGALDFPVPCTEQEIYGVDLPIVGEQTINAYICDVNKDDACTAADDDPSNRPNGLCQVSAGIDGVALMPHGNADGSVDLGLVVNLRVNTGKIPISAPKQFGFTLGTCEIEFDTDINDPPYLPINVRLPLKIDPVNGDQLAIGKPVIDDLTDIIDTDELRFSGSGFLGTVCRAGNLPFLTDLLLGQVEDMILDAVYDAVDGFRCLPCDENDACPGTATCSDDLCYTSYSNRDCIPAVLGMEGRADLGEMLGDFGARDASLDLSIVAGGRNPNGTPSTRVENEGLVFGVMGGSRAQPALCVPPKTFVQRPPVNPMNFDAEVTAPSPDGRSVAGYHLGFALGDAFFDKTAHEAWASGALCLEIGTDTVDLLSSSLLSTFIPSLTHLTQDRNVPMLLALRPFNPPEITIGRGSVKEGPEGPIPDDPLLTISIPDLNIDFYALLEERYFRLFTLAADLELPLSLEFDPVEGTMTPVLGSLTSLLGNARGKNGEILAENPEQLAAVIDSLIGLVQPQLAGGLSPISLPEIEGMVLDILGIRGSVKLPSGPGYEHLALFAKLELQGGLFPMTTRFDTQATLESFEVPEKEALLEGARPRAVLSASALGLRPSGFKGMEYSWRVNGGLWRPWTHAERFEVAAPELMLQGRHLLEVRARERGVAASADLSPARIELVVDYEAPRIKLRLDPEEKTVHLEAFDAVTHPDDLLFRHRIGAEGEWSPWGHEDVFALADLGAEPLLYVEAKDESGRIGSARFGQELSYSPRTLATEEGQGGCATAPLSLATLLALGLIARRRRA